MLTDIDKIGTDRSNPRPNTHDVVPEMAFPARGANSVNYISAASNSDLLSAAKNGQLTIISSDIVTAPSVEYPSGGVGAFASSTIKVLTIPHGLPFIPIVVAYYYDGTVYNVMPARLLNGGGSLGIAQWTTFRVSTDATNVYFYADLMAYGDSSGIYVGPLQFKYYLMYQTSNQ